MTNRLRYLILTADLISVAVTCVLAHLIRFRLMKATPPPVETPYFYALLLGATLIIWTTLYLNKDLDGFSRGWHFPTVSSQVIVATIYLVGSLVVFAFVLRFDYSRLALLFVGLLLPVALLTNRCIARCLVSSLSRISGTRRVVILGGGPVARELGRKIQKHPELMIEIAGFLYPRERGSSSKASGSSTELSSLNALDFLREKRVRELILAEPLPPGPEGEKLIASCHSNGIQVRLVPQWYELYLSRARLTEIEDVPLISIESRSLPFETFPFKRIIDIAIGSVLLVAVAPVLVLVSAILIWRKGSAVRRELRCGRNGSQFSMYRFNIDRWDPHLVGFERFFAKFSLTELPQLWNVLRGDMSLVGPRPESPERVKHYSIWQRQRLSVKPGLTGLAQVYGLREHHSSEAKAHFDLRYIYHCSMFYDFSIVLQTAWTLMFRLFDRNQHQTEVPPKTSRGAFTLREALHVDSPQSGAN
jgi:lipopolysaccharide/colanic/teichoic acid biosynthesis glycosyltransferase